MGAILFTIFIAIIGLIIFSYDGNFGLEILLNPKRW